MVFVTYYVSYSSASECSGQLDYNKFVGLRHKLLLLWSVDITNTYVLWINTFIHTTDLSVKSNHGPIDSYRIDPQQSSQQQQTQL